MSHLQSLFLILILLFLWIKPLHAEGQLKRFIVKRNGKVKIEYHLTDPQKKKIKSYSLGINSKSSNSSSIEYADVDNILSVQIVKNDKTDFQVKRVGAGDQFTWQWSLGFNAGGIEVEDGWNESLGKSSLVIAVVDTGILNHQELAGRVLPGYDFVSDIAMANDGNGRDADASDPGDWITAGDSCYTGQFSQSSWHGTHVAGIIGANGDNSEGISGIDLRAKILPIRVLGKCGGYTSDIADGVRWAAGGQVAGVPNNPNPAKVINLSLGGRGGCGSYMQSAINYARSRGAVVVVAAGNDGASINNSQYTPANCNGVITVASNNQFGRRSNFSNHGSIVDITAPGGGQGGGIISLGNLGTTSPGSMSYVTYNGTSMATPHVAAVAGLIAAVKSGLYPDQIESILELGSRAFGLNSQCTTETCGAGILNVLQSLILATTTVPDSQFRVGDETVVSAPVESEDNFSSQRDGAGGFCGSIDLSGGDGGSGGNGPLSLILIALAFLTFNKRAISRS